MVFLHGVLRRLGAAEAECSSLKAEWTWERTGVQAT